MATAGPPPPAPNPPGAFSFAALGDAPYYIWEDVQYRLVLQDLDAHQLSLVLHVGDIFWHPCTDAQYRRTLGWFNRLPHAVIYTPGDNEWADCWERGSGGFDPQERLARIRQIFFAAPTRSLGGSLLPLVTQGSPFAEFVENARWEQQGFVFATVNLPGSMNGLEEPTQRTPAGIAATKRRTEAAAAWVREAFAAARTANAAGVVVGFHANPPFEEPASDPYRRAYEPWLTVLDQEVERFPRPVLAVNGDDHEYLVDHPLTGRANFTRLQVPGSPLVGWVRIVVTPGAEAPFQFEKRVVPRWKYW